jgi:hypothetical protein
LDFLIADTFSDSLARLTGDEQKAVKTTAFDLQMNPANPGMHFHKLEKSKDKSFWSVRVNSDIRLIVHRGPGSLLLCYVDHHDKAYDWAERRKIETHPKTGAAQLVEVRETVKEIIVPVYIEAAAEMPPAPVAPLKIKIFAEVSEDELLGYGVPEEWLADVKSATEDSLLSLSDHLPAEASEALLELATGGKPRKPEAPAAVANPFAHPDARRRFRVLTNVEELERALDYPWDKWTIFLHPEQRQIVEREYSGPARVSGSAGTGKTIVALHRAAHLARTHANSRVLLTTFSDSLAHALKVGLRRLLANEPRLGERIDVHSLNAVGLRLHKLLIGPATIAAPQWIKDALKRAAAASDAKKYSAHFLWTEWDQVVDAWQLRSWEQYRDVVRLGRKTKLPEAQRQMLWSVFESVRNELASARLITYAELFTNLAETIKSSGKVIFDYVIVDEAQDLSVAHLRFLASLGMARPDALFFAGDLGQRIFQQPFSWKALGVDVRGRARTLRVNYRTSHQIRMQADRLLGATVSDVDGNDETRSDTVSVFNGPAPTILALDTTASESKAVSNWLLERLASGVSAHELGVIVRSQAQIERARQAVEGTNTPFRIIDDHVETEHGTISICTMHLAKGLEFRSVAVMACDDEVIPLQERIEQVGDDADLKEVYDTERHLLYVACTRARDHLLVTGVTPTSEYLDDLRGPAQAGR